MYSAIEIAKYIINWCNDNLICITNLKLQKLLYFVQGEIVKATGKRLITEDFYAWQLGPVIPEVYKTFSVFSSSSIPKQTLSIELALSVEEHIADVLREYANENVWDLVELSHSQDPWKYHHAVFGDKTKIPFESIKNYFKGVTV